MEISTSGLGIWPVSKLSRQRLYMASCQLVSFSTLTGTTEDLLPVLSTWKGKVEKNQSSSYLGWLEILTFFLYCSCPDADCFCFLSTLKFQSRATRQARMTIDSQLEMWKLSQPNFNQKIVHEINGFLSLSLSLGWG